MKQKYGAWLSDENPSIGEIVAGLGYDFVVLDVEHGSFDLSSLNRFIPLLKGLGLEVLAKVLVPERGAVQQVLDFGADGVIIPHIEGAEHAKKITEYAKFPPIGSRSLAGGRTMKYSGYDDAWVAAQNCDIRVFPMVEDPGALEDIEQIAALESVDGIFIGPGDLSLMRGRGTYAVTDEDLEDFRKVVRASRENEKPWVLPAWTSKEKAFAVQEGAEYIILIMQHNAIAAGYQGAHDEMKAIAEQESKAS
ncbi:MAG: HpcH/HpaI aldolase family protein [Canibacter sp.]